MNTANLFLMSILFSALITNDINNTKNLEEIDLNGGRAFFIADVTKVNLNDKGNSETNVFTYCPPNLVINAADQLLDYKTSDNRHNSKGYGIKNKYATLPENNHAKRKKQKRDSGLKIPNGRDIKNQHFRFLNHEYNKFKRKVIV